MLSSVASSSWTKHENKCSFLTLPVPECTMHYERARNAQSSSGRLHQGKMLPWKFKSLSETSCIHPVLILTGCHLLITRMTSCAHSSIICIFRTLYMDCICNRCSSCLNDDIPVFADQTLDTVLWLILSDKLFFSKGQLNFPLCF